MHSPIYFDARWCGHHGIGRFASELQQRLPGVRPLSIAGPKLSPIDPLAISIALAGKRDGCYFSPGFNPPLYSPIPVAFTIHDLIHLKVPSESTALRRLYYATVVRPAARSAWRVLTDSQHSRRDIAEWSGLPEASIHVVGAGVSSAFSPVGAVHTAGRPYFLHVGRRASHKNIDRLLQAFKLSATCVDMLLVFTGAADAPTLEAASAFGLAGSIVFSGDLRDEQLACLYRGATALVFPSLYEGFGLPVVESMACGTPVITSNVNATAETAGDGNALLVDPRDVDALAQAMRRLAGSDELRQALSQRGLARAAAFSWADVGARVAKALDLAA